MTSDAILLSPLASRLDCRDDPAGDLVVGPAAGAQVSCIRRLWTVAEPEPRRSVHGRQQRLARQMGGDIAALQFDHAGAGLDRPAPIS
ncbi:MAG: hypothetical protein Q4G36_05230 [Paracoccus sp. (in: a-proteobacteria)]|nr:hypothetical protein [Paracoccus sp. (in: a-proteobacteria)]